MWLRALLTHQEGRAAVRLDAVRLCHVATQVYKTRLREKRWKKLHEENGRR